jgi:hypothetical protein
MIFTKEQFGAELIKAGKMLINNTSKLNEIMGIRVWTMTGSWRIELKNDKVVVSKVSKPCLKLPKRSVNPFKAPTTIK